MAFDLVKKLAMLLLPAPTDEEGITLSVGAFLLLAFDFVLLPLLLVLWTPLKGPNELVILVSCF